jgi:RNA polymerase sigma-70 factor (ECF subfamily)
MESVLEALAPAIHRFGMRMCRHPDDAADASQDTLIAVAKNLPSFEGRSSLTSWVFTLARTACARRRRGLKNRPTLPEEAAPEPADTHQTPEEDVASRDLGARVVAALDGLPEEWREVIALRDVEGLSAAEAASVLGISVDALKSRLHRARSGLREALRPLVEPKVHKRAACPEVVMMLSRHLEGDLAAEDCAAMEKHLEACPDCASACATAKRALAACRATASGPVPEAVKLRVRRALSALTEA